jgi:hypothetical protein
MTGWRTELLALLMVAVEAALLISAVKWPARQTGCAFSCNTCSLRSPTRLRRLSVINMLLISTFAPQLMIVFGLRSNVGNI